jgi:hypothetical protein
MERNALFRAAVVLALLAVSEVGAFGTNGDFGRSQWLLNRV